MVRLHNFFLEDKTQLRGTSVTSHRPVQLNSSPLHKELIKLISRRWTKLSSTKRVNVWAFRKTSCKGKPLRGYCEHAATAALPASTPQPGTSGKPSLGAATAPSSFPRGFLPPACSHQLGRGGEQDIWKWARACQGWGCWTLSRWIYHKDKPLLKQLRYWQKVSMLSR